MAEADGAFQVRKPYTITKPREKWLDEEHNKFLEAVQLHGRAWRLIEEHIGTKTAVQIRSHAQKFVSKMAKDANYNGTSNMKPFEIPPPRPKKKPTHPYPRKQILSEHNRSPSSTLSAVGLESIDLFLSNNSNGCASPVEFQPELNDHDNGVLSAKNSVEGDDIHLQLSLALPGLTTEDEPNLELNLNSFNERIHSKEASSSAPTASAFKLFGRTLMIPDSHKQHSAIAAEEDHRSFQHMTSEHNCNAMDLDSGRPAEETINGGFPMNGTWLVGFTPACYCWPTAYGIEPNPTNEAQVIPMPWLSFYANMPFPFADTQQLIRSREDLNQANLQNECSGTGSNNDHDGAIAVKSKQDECGDEEETGLSVVRKARKIDNGSAMSSNKGFVPYRRCDSGEKVKRPSSAGESVGDS